MDKEAGTRRFLVIDGEDEADWWWLLGFSVCIIVVRFFANLY
jgi:hypothetical protein